MVKTKNKKGASSDRVHLKKEPKKMNPFEVHVNKEKLKVIGKKQKNDRGLPGISRAKAIKKRKSTLLEEYKVQNKNNKFIDRRIGENANMDIEEKSMARYTALKMKSHSKKNIFNLADDEILTHKGQTLSEIEKFDDPRSDDDFSDDENKTGNLDTKFIKEAHFGGGILRNTGKEGAMTHKDLINQLIVESKKRKAEKQQAKEATLELTEKLDSDWKDLIPLVTKDAKSKEEEIVKQKVNDYDKVMRELKFEKRGTVSDRLKTENEIAQDEKESLEKLEQERIRRMNKDENEDKPKPKHRSADDLDDGFVYDNDDTIEENVLSYNQEGKSNFQIEANVNGNIIKVNDDVVEEEHEKQETEIKEKEGKNKQEEEETEDEEQESENIESVDEEIQTDSEDNLSDLKDSESESEDEQNENLTEETKNFTRESKKDTGNKISVNYTEKILPHKDKTLIEMKKLDAHADVKEKNYAHADATEKFDAHANVTEKIDIPFTFKLLDSYEDLLKTLEDYEGNQHVVLERMIKCNHPSLSEQNKDKLSLLFAYLLQYLNDLFSENLERDSIKNNFKIFQLLVPQIYSLAQLSNQNAHNSMLEVIKEKFVEYRKKPRAYPGLEVLIFFKLVSVLFPTSDLRHQVVTPCYVFMELMLTKCRVKCRRSISYGLFVSSLILEYSALSKRFLPAVINYLSGLLHMAIPKTGVKLLKIPPPFKSTSTILVLLEDYTLKSLDSLKLKSTDFCQEEITPEYQVRVLHNVAKILQHFLEYYKVLPSHVEVFERALNYLELIPLHNYPKEVQNNLKNLVKEQKKCKDERQLEYIVQEASKPKALRLYEPKIQVVYDGKQHKVQSKEKAQINKLLHKVKREKKGALREIRRDNAFLGRVKLNNQLQSDKERREKVKRIYSEAAVQQSELNAIDRKKNKKN